MRKDGKPANECIKLFRSLFSGRDDAYGLETPDGYKAVRQPLTDELLRAHLAGTARVGIYPILPENVVKFSVFDFDVDPNQSEFAAKLLKEPIEKVYAASFEHELYPYLIRSKRRGYHEVCFFDNPIPAKAIRLLMSRILNETGIKAEIFPKQDTVSGNGTGDGLGNFLWLPLQGQSIKNDRTVFVDLGLNPYPDQYSFLQKIHLSKSENVLLWFEKIESESKPERNGPDAKSQTDGKLDLRTYLKHYGRGFRIKEELTRTFFLLDECPFSKNHTTKNARGDCAIVQGADGKITFQCFHGHCQGKTFRDARQAISGHDRIDQFWVSVSSPRGRRRNLVEDLRLWVENAFSKFTTEQIHRDLSMATPKDKAHIRVELHRMVERGIIERGTVNGTFIKIESESSEIRIKEQIPVPLSVILPGDLHKRVSIYPKSLIVGAGSSNGGKTAYGLNCAYENRNKFDVRYFTTEMDSDELTLRTHNFGYPMEEWGKIKFRAWKSCHSIKPDGFNILDYLEVREGEFWRVGDDLRKIFERLQVGIAIVFIQMDRGKQFGWGGQKTVDKARLYFTIDDNKLTIIKGKNWSCKTDNPNGKAISFKLHNGSIFEWGSWS